MWKLWQGSDGSFGNIGAPLRRSASCPIADLHVETVDFRLVPTAGVHPGHFCPGEELDVEAALVLLASLGNLIGRERRGAGSEPAGHKIDDSGDFSVGIAIAKSGHEFFA